MGQDLRASLPGDRFGWYVSLSGDGRTVAVSARLGDLPSENKFDAGYVRVFTYNGNLSQSNNTILRRCPYFVRPGGMLVPGSLWPPGPSYPGH
jgi:hypothetical protein